MLEVPLPIELGAPVSLKRLIAVGLPWLCDKIEQHSNYPEIHTPEGTPWDYRYWVQWALEHGFVYVWPDPPTLGLIGRPVTKDMIYNAASYPQDKLLYLYDHKGDGIWVDFLWAPGQYSIVMKFLKMTGKTWVGWQHHTSERPHIRLLKSME